MRMPSRRIQIAMIIAWVSIATAIPVGMGVLDAPDLAPMRLKVDLSERKLYVLDGGEVVKTYPVAVGKPGSPTPTGGYRTGRIEWNPRWVPPPRKWARGMKPREPGDPRNPMQGVKIYFREPWYYIHGTNEPASIGTAASRGCIRMRVSDAVALARRIQRNGGSVPLQIVR